MGDVHRLIAFDLDGTLIESRRDLAEAANALLSELGATPLPEPSIARMVGEGAAVLVRRALDAAGLGDVPGALQRFLEIYDTRLLNHTHLYDGVIDAVRIARRSARVAVLTNKPQRPTERILDGLHVRHLFDEVIGGDSKWGRKPDTAGLQALMQGAGATAERTLLVGDSAIDLETARRAGVRCCLVTFGFGFENLSRDRLTGDEWIVSDVAALTAAIERFTSA